MRKPYPHIFLAVFLLLIAVIYGVKAFGADNPLVSRDVLSPHEGTWDVDHATANESGVDFTTFTASVARITSATIEFLTAPSAALTTVSLDLLQFNTSYEAPNHSEGQVYWDSTDKTLALHSDIIGPVMQLGQEEWVRVRNITGATITDGSVVYCTGATGNRPTVALAQADTTSTARTLGLATHDIGHNEDGYITVSGIVRNVDTSDYVAGDMLYLSPTIAGATTSTLPIPNGDVVVRIGLVTNAHITQGRICVRIEQFKDHSELSGKQGGAVGERYHLTQDQHDRNMIGTITDATIPKYNSSADELDDSILTQPSAVKIQLGADDAADDLFGIGASIITWQESNARIGMDSIFGYDNGSGTFMFTANGGRGLLQIGPNETAWDFIAADNTTKQVFRFRTTGAGQSILQIYSPNDSEIMQFYHDGTYGYIENSTGGTGIAFNRRPQFFGTVDFYPNSTEGLSEPINIYGKYTGGAAGALSIGKGIDAIDSASFYGVSNYLFGTTAARPYTLDIGVNDTSNDILSWADGAQSITYNEALDRLDVSNTLTIENELIIGPAEASPVIIDSPNGILDVFDGLLAGNYDLSTVVINGFTALGDGGGTDYTSISQTGHITLMGAATVWDDLRVPVNAIRLGAASPPTWDTFSSTTQIYWFAANTTNEVHFSVQMPHSWKEGTDLGAHVHWAPENATGGHVEWILDYTWADIDEVFAIPSTIRIGDDSQGLGLMHQMANNTATGSDIDATGKTISSMLVCRLYRDGNLSDTMGSRAGLLEIDFHYERDTMGSNTEYVK